MPHGALIAPITRAALLGTWGYITWEAIQGWEEEKQADHGKYVHR